MIHLNDIRKWQFFNVSEKQTVDVEYHSIDTPCELQWMVCWPNEESLGCSEGKTMKSYWRS